MGNKFGMDLKVNEFLKYQKTKRAVKINHGGHTHFGYVKSSNKNFVELLPYIIYHHLPSKNGRDIEFIYCETKLPKLIKVGSITNHDPLAPRYLEELIERTNANFSNLQLAETNVVLDSKGFPIMSNGSE